MPDMSENKPTGPAITLTQAAPVDEIPDSELGAKVKTPMIDMARSQAAAEGVTLIGDPHWEHFYEDGKRYSITMTWPVAAKAEPAEPPAAG